jgi:hypothetical protein
MACSRNIKYRESQTQDSRPVICGEMPGVGGKIPGQIMRALLRWNLKHGGKWPCFMQGSDMILFMFLEDHFVIYKTGVREANLEALPKSMFMMVGLMWSLCRRIKVDASGYNLFMVATILLDDGIWGSW